MGRHRIILLALVGALLLGGAALLALVQSQALWTWGGRQLVDLARARLPGRLTVQAVAGHPLTGFTFTGVDYADAQGQVLQAQKIDLRFSLWSVALRRPVIARLEITAPRLILRRDAQGRVAAPRLARPAEAPAPPSIRKLTFAAIRVEQGQVIIKGGQADKVFQDLEMDLALVLTDPGRPSQDIQADLGNLTAATPWGSYTLAGQARTHKGRLTLNSVALGQAGQRLASMSGEAPIRPDAGAGHLNLKLDPIPGGVPGRFWPRWPEAWGLQGEARLDWQDGGRMQLAADLRLQDVALGITGSLCRRAAGWQYDLDLKAQGLNRGLLAPVQAPWAQRLKDQALPPLALHLQALGDGPAWPPERLDWRLSVLPFNYRQAQVEQFSLSLQGDGREQRLEALVRGNFGQVSLKAAGPLLTGPKGSLEVRAEGLQPGALDLAKGTPARFNAGFAGSFSLPETGAWAGLKVAGDLSAQGRVGEMPLDDLKARLAWAAPRLEVAQARLRLGPLNAEFSGSLTPEQVEAQARASLAPGDWRPPAPISAQGKLDLTASVKGPWAALQYNLEAQGHGLGAGGVRLNSLALKAAGRGWPPAAGEVDIQGRGLHTQLGHLAQVNLKARGEGYAWRFDLNAADAALKAALKGSAAFQPLPVSLAVERFSCQTKELRLVNVQPLKLRLRPGFELEPAAFRVNDGEVSLAGALREDRLHGRLELRRLPAQALPFPGPHRQGLVNGHLTLEGAPAQPQIQGRIFWTPGQIGGFAFQSLEAGGHYRGGMAHLDGKLVEKPDGPRLTLEGRVPLALSLAPLACSLGERDLYLKVQGEGANLALLTAFGPQVQAAQGNLDLLAEWRGNPRRPQVSGQLKWGESSLKLRVAGAPYRLRPGQATLQAQKITIPELIFESGGVFRLQGDVSLAGFIPQNVDLRGQMEDFIAIRRGGTQAEGRGAVQLRGPADDLRLTGHLLLSRTTFATSFFQMESHPEIEVSDRLAPPPEPEDPLKGPALWKNMVMDLTLESKGDVWVKNKFVNIALAGSLKAYKPAGKERAAVLGGLRATQGTIDLQGRTFKVAQGSVNMGQPGQPVTLEGQAVNDMGPVTITMHISGPAKKPVVRFTSTPPMPPPDILAYLVFGRPTASLSREEYTSVGQQALSLLGGITAKKLQDMLGKDFPLVSDVTLKTKEQVVGITKPLTKELSVSFERRADPLRREDVNQVRLEYKVNRYMSVESTAGQRSTGGDVLFNYDF
jgi:translocation and assembly module TamB